MRECSISWLHFDAIARASASFDLPGLKLALMELENALAAKDGMSELDADELNKLKQKAEIAIRLSLRGALLASGEIERVMTAAQGK